MSISSLNALYCYIVLLFAICFFAIHAENGDKLKLLHIVFRHGDRAPIQTYKTDPNPTSSWPSGLGELTKLGCKQQYMMGTLLRNRYQTFITGNPLEVRVRSSDRDRCLNSAQCHLMGLYQPNASQQWDPKINWQPIPIHTRPIAEDGVLVPGYSSCPNAKMEDERVHNSEECLKILDSYAELYANVTKLAGQKASDFYSAGTIYDISLTEKVHNLTIPKWVEDYYDELKHQLDLSFTWYAKSKQQKRFRAGPLIKVITDNMWSFVRNESALGDYKVFIFSTHDTEVASLLELLGIFDGLSPPYCATVLIELWESAATKHHTVKIYYLNALNTTVVPLSPEGCNASTGCSLSKFLDDTAPFVPTDWDAECGNYGIFQFAPGAVAIIIALGTMCAFFVCVLCVQCVCCARKRTPSRPKTTGVVYSPLPNNDHPNNN